MREGGGHQGEGVQKSTKPREALLINLNSNLYKMAENLTFSGG